MQALWGYCGCGRCAGGNVRAGIVLRIWLEMEGIWKHAGSCLFGWANLADLGRGRRTQYRYEEGCLTDVVHTDVVHTDERITLYEYDGFGHITSVTDQNGSDYLENTYDEKGRVIFQRMGDGVCHTFTYDDAHHINTSYNGAHPSCAITPKGEETAYEYDRVGRRISVSNQYGTGKR